MYTLGIRSVTFVGVFALGFFAMSTIGGVGSTEIAPAASMNLVEESAGEEITLVLMVSSMCGWSNNPDLPPAWHALAKRIERTRPKEVQRVTRIGIAEAETIEAGVQFLSSFGELHEISTGRTLNNGALRYLYTDLRGPIAYPQVLVVHREFILREDGSMHRQSERVVQRLVGLEAIKRAAGRGEMAMN